MACSYHATPQAVEDLIPTQVTSCRMPIPRVGSARPTVYLLALFKSSSRFWPDIHHWPAKLRIYDWLGTPTWGLSSKKILHDRQIKYDNLLMLRMDTNFPSPVSSSYSSLIGWIEGRPVMDPQLDSNRTTATTRIKLLIFLVLLQEVHRLLL